MARLDSQYELIKEVANKYSTAIARILERLAKFLNQRNVEQYGWQRIHELVRQIVENEIRSLHMDKFLAKVIMQATMNNIQEWSLELRPERRWFRQGLTMQQVETIMARSRRQLRVAYNQVLAASKSVEATMLRSANRIARGMLEEIVTAKRLGVPIQQSLRTTGKFLKDMSFVDKKGRKWNPTSYMEMAARTQVHSIDGEISKHLTNEIDNDLRIIDTQMGSCPICFNFSDNVIAMNRQASKKQIQEIQEDGFIYAGTYNNIIRLGWGHPNCRCIINVYIPTVSAHSVNTNEAKNSKNYKDRQKQRYMERQIRKYKYAEKGATLWKDQEKYHRKMLDWQKQLREFSHQNNLSRIRWRESITFDTQVDGQWELNWLLGKTDQLNKEFFERITTIH